MLTVSYVKVFSQILSSSPTQFIPGQHLRVFEKFSYDAFGQNVRVLASGKEENQTFFVDRLLLFREVKYRGLRIQSKTYILQYSSDCAPLNRGSAMRSTTTTKLVLRLH